ncbi:MAG TPA: transposase zinc-binding domain-containing protein [Candidatus Krumholzibacteria bacterium]
MSTVEHPVRRMALTTIYGLGLRLGEGLKLQVRHIESSRQLVMVRSGKGGTERARDWVERQRAALLPVPYFHVVFTVPAELRQLVRAHQNKLIGVLFRAAFESLVPPRGLHRVRAFGLLHPSRRVTLQRLQLLLRHELPEPQETEVKEEERCSRCGSTSWVRGPRLSPEQCIAVLVELAATAGGLGARAPPMEATS